MRGLCQRQSPESARVVPILSCLQRWKCKYAIYFLLSVRQRGETNTVVSQVTHLPAPLDTEPKIYSAQRRIVLATGLCYVLNVTVWKNKKLKQTNRRFIVTKYCYCQNAFFPSLRVPASQQRGTQAGVPLNPQCEGAYLVISSSLLIIVCFDLKMKKWHYRCQVQIYI